MTRSCQKALHGGVLTHSIPPMVLQPWLSSVSSHGSCSVHCSMASTRLKMSIPLPNACNPVDIHFHYMLPVVFTHPWWMLQQKSTGEVITSHWSTQGSLAGLILGDCQTTIFLWHNLAFTPFGSWLNWGGVGTSVPCMTDTNTQGNTSLWCNEEKSVAV